MKRYLLSIIAPLLLLCVGSSYADLTINITQGVDKPYPIAVVPFGDSTAGSPQGIAGVINNDLGMSGQFAALPFAQLPQQPHTAGAISWSLWAPANLEFLVIGQVQSVGDDRYNVGFQVVSTLNQKPMLSRSFNNVSANQMRALGHYISDLIYQAVTGIRGNFSTRLAYVEVVQGSQGPLYRLLITDADGQNTHLLLQQPINPIASPIWSPDGKKLAYVSYQNNRMTIYVITLATGERRVVASFPGINSAPDWSPDSRTMAMALSLGKGSKTDIYVMNAMTRQLTRLTNFATNTSPRFSPDGKNMVFTSDRSGQPQIYQMNLATRQVTRLTYQGLKNFSATYTPDGKSIVFMYQATGDGAIQIATMNVSGGAVRVLTNGQLDKSPSIAPNGQMIIYANYDSPNGVLAETSINGRIHLQLPAAQGSVQSPAWSPFLT